MKELLLHVFQIPLRCRVQFIVIPAQDYVGVASCSLLEFFFEQSGLVMSTIESLVEELQSLRLEAEHIRERESHVLAQLIYAGRREKNVPLCSEPWYVGQKSSYPHASCDSIGR